jgi:hypothetical protein
MIHGANLVENDMSGAPGKLARDAERVPMAPGREWSHDEGTDMGVELVGRDDRARSGLADLAAPPRIQVDQEDFAPTNGLRRYHCHSSSSNRVAVGSSMSRSSFRSRI